MGSYKFYSLVKTEVVIPRLGEKINANSGDNNFPHE